MTLAFLKYKKAFDLVNQKVITYTDTVTHPFYIYQMKMDTEIVLFG